MDFDFFYSVSTDDLAAMKHFMVSLNNMKMYSSRNKKAMENVENVLRAASIFRSISGAFTAEPARSSNAILEIESLEEVLSEIKFDSKHLIK